MTFQATAKSSRCSTTRLLSALSWLMLGLGSLALGQASPTPSAANASPTAPRPATPGEGVPSAAASNPTTTINRPAHAFRTVSIDEQVKELAKSLDLNKEQQSAIKRILLLRQEEILRIRREGPGSDGIPRFRVLQMRTMTQIRAVLNDEQRKKYNPLGQRPPQPTSPQPSVEDWLKATTPH